MPLLCLALALPGCIFAEPPQTEPTQTPVFFDLDRAVPPITKLLEFGDQDPPVDFNVPFRSEDANETVHWAVHLNLNVGGDAFSEIGPNIEEPSRLNDLSRRIVFRFHPSQFSNDPDPCSQLTLMACHRHALVDERCEDNEDTDFAVWWVSFGDSTVTTLSDCPDEPLAP